MRCQHVTKTFKVVGLKGEGAFVNFGTEVPELAQQFLRRIDEVKNHSGIEIALYEPKRDHDHQEGHYYVGIMINEHVKKVPPQMNYIETGEHYAMTRGKLKEISSLYEHLLKWLEKQGDKRDLTQYIVETYHPMGDGEEEVVIYLPIYS